MALRRASELWTAQTLTIGHIAVPKTRKPKFELHLRIVDLNNVPLVSGTSFIKWHLPSSTAAEHRGRTSKCTIKDHKVSYDYVKVLNVRLVVGKDKMLQETWIHFEILQEYSSGGRGERITLGNIKLNLAEYVEASEHSTDGEDGVTRRYLMQESKINSTLKIGIFMRHIEGDRDYYAPPLRTAPVFGGIAGIMAQEAPEAADDLGTIPSLSSKSRETGEMQDMYRRTLAASWAAQPGELRADKCIEDIFAGGDGWGLTTDLRAEGGSYSDDARSRNASATNLATPSSTNLNRSPKSKQGRLSTENARRDDRAWRKAMDGWSRDGGGGLGKPGAVSGRSSLEQQARKMERDKSKGRESRPLNEVDEFEVKDDLR
ncbi:hypothetical protein H2203_001492, partial [Taxawa tesnikishii (nom. ined.)]